MGILDDLREQTNQKKKQALAQKSQKQLLRQNYENKVLPQMQKAYYFLREIVDHLRYIDLKTEVTEYSSRYPQCGKLIQQNYHISTDGRGGIGNIDELKEINVSFVLNGPGEFSYKIKYKSKIDQEVEFLHDNKIPYFWFNNSSADSSDIGIFKITRKIPVLFRISVDYQNSRIIMDIYNHDDISYFTKSFSPNDIDDAWLDRLARYLLRKDDDFIRLEITPEQRQFIRNQAKHYGDLTNRIKELISMQKK